MCSLAGDGDGLLGQLRSGGLMSRAEDEQLERTGIAAQNGLPSSGLWAAKEHLWRIRGRHGVGWPREFAENPAGNRTAKVGLRGSLPAPPPPRRDGLVASSLDKHKGSPGQQGGSCQIGETKGYTWPYLPEDIWLHIHSLMPLRDAARAACVCRAFLYSWRSFPNLTFSKQTLGLNDNAGTKDEIIRDFTNRVDHIMKNHLGIGVKTLKLVGAPNNSRYQRRLDSWLQKAVTPGIEEVTLSLAEQSPAKKYKFPWSILSHGNGDSFRRLVLANCAFHPTLGFGCLRSLVTLDLFNVHIKGDELGCLLSNSLALEFLGIRYCHKLVYVKIPSLQQLNHLSVLGCFKLQLIESKAPNLSSFHFESEDHVQISLGKELQVKKLYIDCSGPFYVSSAELASMPNLEAGLHPNNEMAKTPLVSNKFLYLECLSITLKGLTFQSFDYSSMGSSPSLETFILNVSQQLMEHPIYHRNRFYSYARTWVYETCLMLRAWLN